ncbi:MAG: OmpA family protein [Pseudomonadota bacterium]
MKRSERTQHAIAQYRATGLTLAQSSRLAQISSGRSFPVMAGAVGLGAVLLGLGLWSGMTETVAAPAATQPLEQVVVDEKPATEPEPAAIVSVDPEKLSDVTPAVVEVPAPAPAEKIVAVPDCVDEMQAMARDKRILFDVSSAEVTPTAMEQIAAFAIAASNCPDAAVVVAGHSDASGVSAVNLELSWARADATIAAIESLGFETARMQPLGFGARLPVGEGDVADDELNRRVEFQVSRIQNAQEETQ